MRFFKNTFNKVTQLLTGRKPIDDNLFDELEELLIQADLSIHTTTELVDALREAARKERLSDTEDVKTKLKSLIVDMLDGGAVGLTLPVDRPAVYLFVGVNGVGKTTTIAKVAHRFKKQGKKVILAAGDTFRAAAIEQLEIWAGRVGVDIIKTQTGADPGAVVFDAIQAAKARGADVVIADTAGRLHTKSNLMDELGKIGRTVEKALGRKADETILVLDATTGQNAVIQAKEFTNAATLSGICLSKMDGTAKGGIVITIRKELGIPVKFITTGEKVGDIEDFDPVAFVEALFEEG